MQVFMLYMHVFVIWSVQSNCDVRQTTKYRRRKVYAVLGPMPNQERTLQQYQLQTTSTNARSVLYVNNATFLQLIVCMVLMSFVLLACALYLEKKYYRHKYNITMIGLLYKNNLLRVYDIIILQMLYKILYNNFVNAAICQ